MGNEYAIAVGPTADASHDSVREAIETHLPVTYERTDSGVLVFAGDDAVGDPAGPLADDDRASQVDRMTVVTRHGDAVMYTGKYYEHRNGTLELVERLGLDVPASPEWLFSHFFSEYGIAAPI